MNIDLLLRDLGDERGPQDEAPPAELRRRVLTASAAQRRPDRWRVFGPRLAGLGGLTGAALAVVIAGQALNTSGTVGVSDPPASAPAEARAVADPGSVLRLAAQHAAIAPDFTGRPDQFVLVTSVEAGIQIHNEGRDDAGRRLVRAAPAPARSVEEWRSVDGEHHGISRERQYPSDRTWVSVPIPGCRDGRWAPTIDRPAHTEACTPRPGYRSDLPTDAQQMRRYLYRAGATSKGFGEAETADQRAFRAAAEVLRQSVLAPKSQAAVFEAVSTIPGTTVRTGVQDITGRRGIAVARTDNGIRDELIFDSSTYAYLGTNATIVDGTALSSRTVRVTGLRPGDPVAREAILSAAVVDEAGDRP